MLRWVIKWSSDDGSATVGCLWIYEWQLKVELIHSFWFPHCSLAAVKLQLMLLSKQAGLLCWSVSSEGALLVLLHQVDVLTVTAVHSKHIFLLFILKAASTPIFFKLWWLKHCLILLDPQWVWHPMLNNPCTSMDLSEPETIFGQSFVARTQYWRSTYFLSIYLFPAVPQTPALLRSWNQLPPWEQWSRNDNSQIEACRETLIYERRRWSFTSLT